MPHVKTIPEQKITVYKFEELSQEAKEKAFNYYMEHYYFDAEFLKDGFKEELKQVGVYVDTKDMYWSAERGREWYFYVNQSIEFEDIRLFLKYCKNLKNGKVPRYKGIDLRKKEYGNMLNDYQPQIETSHYSMGRGHNYVTVDYVENNMLTEALNDLFEEFLKQIEDEWDYETSEEYVKEYFDSNETEFDEYGNIV